MIYSSNNNMVVDTFYKNVILFINTRFKEFCDIKALNMIEP